MRNRRQFLKSTLALPLLSSGGSLLGALSSGGARANGPGDYKALVCVFLEGGMDCHDTLLPYDQPAYDAYSTLRAPLLEAYAAEPGGSSRARARLLPLSPTTPLAGGRELALVPELGPLADLFSRGDCAVVANTGPLLEPIASEDYNLSPWKLPARLFSHNDQRYQWMTLAPEGAQYGWPGRFGDAGTAVSATQAFSQISLFGYPAFLNGDLVSPYQMSSGAVRELREPGINLQAERELLREHLGSLQSARDNLFEQDIVAITRTSLDANDRMREALELAVDPATEFPATTLGEQLKTVAKIISIRERLGLSRQVFMVGMRGFDTHSRQAATLPALQAEVGNAIAAFYAATQEMGLHENVTTFTASEFGRTLTVNGDGTDHGWGSHHFVVGGAVNGGDVYGKVPLYEVGHEHDAGSGRLIPTTSIEQFAAPLGRWFGLSDSELSAALPGLPNFTGGGLNFI